MVASAGQPPTKLHRAQLEQIVAWTLGQSIRGMPRAPAVDSAAWCFLFPSPKGKGPDSHEFASCEPGPKIPIAAGMGWGAGSRGLDVLGRGTTGKRVNNYLGP